MKKCRHSANASFFNNESFVQESSFSSGTVTGSSEANNNWETLMANRMNTVNMGAVISSQGQDPSGPTSFSINGQACTLAG